MHLTYRNMNKTISQLYTLNGIVISRMDISETVQMSEGEIYATKCVLLSQQEELLFGCY